MILGTNYSVDSPLGEVVPVAFLRVAKVTLTNDQIKKLPTTPITIIPAPGPNKSLIVPLTLGFGFGHLLLDWTANYTNLDAQLSINFENVGAPYVNLSSSLSQQFLAWGEDVVWQIGFSDFGGSGSGLQSMSFMNNQPVRISITNGVSGNLTGGHANNTLTISLLYNILNLVTGAYE